MEVSSKLPAVSLLDHRDHFDLDYRFRLRETAHLLHNVRVWHQAAEHQRCFEGLLQRA
jgi:hypothetical protein